MALRILQKKLGRERGSDILHLNAKADSAKIKNKIKINNHFAWLRAPDKPLPSVCMTPDMHCCSQN